MADGVFVNYLDRNWLDRVRDDYGGGYKRLCTLKDEWNLAHLFRMNQNIEPTN